MAAVSVSASVKLATIWPSLAMAGVLIAPARPPMPRLSVLPAAIDVGVRELTTPPSAMVSGATRLQPQPLSPPIVSELSAFRTEPAPVTVTVEGTGHVADEHRRRGVDGAAVGDREHAGSLGAAAADKKGRAADIPG